MNHFLHNLIVRHQAAGDNLEANQIVQPRPKSRFETESSATSNLDSGIEEIISSTGKPSSLSSQTPAFHQAKTDKTNSAANTYENSVSELTDVVSNLLVEKPIMRKTPGGSAHSQKNSPIEYQTELSNSGEQLPGVDEPINSQKLSISDELQPRVQTILHRLNALQPEHAGQPSAGKFQLDNAVSDKALTSSQETTIMPEQALGYAQKDSVQNKNIESRSDKQGKRSNTHQSGLLQIPDWLSQIQSELKQQQQQRKINAHKESETVVNVTIGRVEVKAVQTDSAQKPKTSNKPSGIMSLDDYLTQRDKGRA